MIDKQKAITALEAYRAKFRGLYASVVDACIRIIRDLPEENEWIPVTERLPEEYVSVLVHIPGDSPLPTVKEAYVFDGKWYARHDIYSTGEVTHWKPMPEPPGLASGFTDCTWRKVRGSTRGYPLSRCWMQIVCFLELMPLALMESLTVLKSAS